MTDRKADLKAEAARYHDAFLKANEAVTVREVAIARLTAERDRARDIAVALEGQVAAVRALADELGCSRIHTAADTESGQHNVWCNGATWSRATIEEQLRAALDPDPADRGTTPTILDLDDRYFDGQTLPEALAEYEHVHSTTGVCVKEPSGNFCETRRQ